MKSPLLIVSIFAAALVLVAWLYPALATAQDNRQRDDQHTGRWTIHRTELGFEGEVGGPGQSAVNTILLDTATGDTWLMWPSGDQDKPYHWLPVERQQDMVG